MTKLRSWLTAVKDKICAGAKTFHQSIPKWMYLFPSLALLCAILHLIACQSTAFADFLSQWICGPVRFLLAKATCWIPFSLGEMVVISLPILLIVMLSVTVWLARHYSAKLYCRIMAGLLSVLCTLYTLFVLTLAPGYQSSTLDQRLELDRAPVSAEELQKTAEILRDAAQAELEQITFRSQNFSVMPFDLDEMNDKLNDAFETVSREHSFLQSFRSKIKYVMLSEPMSYTHITGVYTFYTGEANLNINFPDYSLPFTAAHELAHQRGIAREDEANFVAFLVCKASDDPYIRYSGYVQILEYVMNSLYSASPDAYNRFYATLDRKLVYEFYASSRFFDQYRDNVAADVSGAVNNSYLQMQGQTAGSRSYGLVVDLAVAYYKGQTPA